MPGAVAQTMCGVQPRPKLRITEKGVKETWNKHVPEALLYDCLQIRQFLQFGPAGHCIYYGAHGAVPNESQPRKCIPCYVSLIPDRVLLISWGRSRMMKLCSFPGSRMVLPALPTPHRPQTLNFEIYYRYSNMLDPSTYETEGLCDSIPLQVPIYPDLEQSGTFRAQED